MARLKKFGKSYYTDKEMKTDYIYINPDSVSFVEQMGDPQYKQCTIGLSNGATKTVDGTVEDVAADLQK